MNKPTYTKDQKKAVLIYSGELALFAVIFMVIGILIMAGVIGIRDWKRYAFTYVTMIGGLWPIIDFIWTIVSKKHRAANSLLDKCFIIPVPLCLIPLDIWILVNGVENVENNVFRFGISIPLCYLALVYAVEAIYHYFKPIPMLLEEDEKEEENKVVAEVKDEKEEKKNED